MRLWEVHGEMVDENHAASAIQPHRLYGTSMYRLHGAVYLIVYALSLSIVPLFSFQAAPRIATSDPSERYAGLRPVTQSHPSPRADRHQLDTQQEYLLISGQNFATVCVRLLCQ